MQFPENCNYDTLLKQNHAPCRRERGPCDAAVAAGRCDRRVRNHTPRSDERERTAGSARTVPLLPLLARQRSQVRCTR
jgi:hypothetical protein